MRVYEVPEEGVAALTDQVGLRREALTRHPRELEFADAYFRQRASHDSTDGT